MLPSSSTTAVKHGPFFLTEKKIQAFKVHEETLMYLPLGTQDQRLDAKQDQLPCGSTRTSSCKFQEMETCMVQACHTPWQPLQNHCWQRKCWMDNIKEWTFLPMPELTRAFCRKDWRGSLLIHPSCSPAWLSWSRDWNELNWINLLTALMCNSTTINQWGWKAFCLRGSVGELLTHSQQPELIKHFASLNAWASYSPTVNIQGVYSISPLWKLL